VATSWDVSSSEGFLAWYDASVGAAQRYAASLCGTDAALAEDLVHDAYVVLLARARSGSLGHASVGLITTSVRHRYLDGLRRRSAEDRRIQLTGAIVAPSDEVDDPTEGLPSHERAALVLRYVDGLSVAEVAAELGLTVHAAESLLMRAKARARKEVRRHG
jgi:RNA polymerase sigma-70 factor, ECF subfamily